MIVAWRVVKARHAAQAFSGEGARRVQGRWHDAGSAVVYSSANRALGMLEVLANFSGTDRQHLPSCVLVSATIPERLVDVLASQDLPPGWDRPAGSPEARARVRRWLADARTVVLQVPSVLVPGEHNYLIDPNHRRFHEIRIGNPIPFAWDPRLKLERPLSQDE